MVAALSPAVPVVVALACDVLVRACGTGATVGSEGSDIRTTSGTMTCMLGARTRCATRKVGTAGGGRLGGGGGSTVACSDCNAGNCKSRGALGSNAYRTSTRFRLRASTHARERLACGTHSNVRSKANEVMNHLLGVEVSGRSAEGRRPGRFSRYAFGPAWTSAVPGVLYTGRMTMLAPAGAVEALRQRLAAVLARIDAACARAARDPATVRLLPVSKTVCEERLRAAYEAGCRMFGENKVQEAQRKWEAMTDLPDLRWSIIGHLQTNKAKVIAEFADEFQALDSFRVAEALDRRLQALGRRMDVLVQVNTSGEESKFGLPPDEVEAFAKQLPAFSSLRVRGLMTLALHSDDADKVRPCFVRLRELRDLLRQSAPDGIAMDELSMGMSGDFELAIEEGSTIVRVGQAIFGTRVAGYVDPSVARREG